MIAKGLTPENGAEVFAIMKISGSGPERGIRGVEEAWFLRKV